MALETEFKNHRYIRQMTALVWKGNFWHRVNKRYLIKTRHENFEPKIVPAQVRSYWSNLVRKHWFRAGKWKRKRENPTASASI